jgi:hypothetical protein
MASSFDAWGGMMIGGCLLGGQTCTFQWPAPSLGVNMSNPYPWYLAKFLGIVWSFGTRSVAAPLQQRAFTVPI